VNEEARSRGLTTRMRTLRTSLRAQVGVGIVLLGAVVVVLLFTVVGPRYQRTFASIERAEVETNVGRARNAVVNELANLETTSHDWASWDEPFEFVQGARPGFAEENLREDTFVNLRLHFMVFLDSAGRILYAESYGLAGNETAAPGEFLAAVDPVLALWLSDGDVSSRSGVIRLGAQLALVAIHPVTSSLHEPPAAGMLVIGRMLDAAEVERLASQIDLPLAVRSIDDPRNSAALLATLTSGDPMAHPTAAVPLDARTVAGYTVWRDLLGEPVGILALETPRDTYRAGMEAMSFMASWLLSMLVVLSGGFLLFLDRRILRRTAHLTSDVGRIAREHDPSQRVPAGGKDELARLGVGINGMLASIAESRDALARSEKQYRNLFESSRDPIYITAEDGRFIDVNQALVDLLGYTKEEIMTMTAGEFYVKREDREAFQVAIREKGFVTGFPVTLKRKDGVHLRCLLTTTLESTSRGRGRVYQGIIRDVTELLRQQEKLTFLATHDPLTGLLTRSALDDVLRLEMARAQRNLDRLAVFYLDLDKFKEINDRHGHAAGDRVLQEVGVRLREALRASDTVARFGGDEFVALLPGIDSPRDAEIAADKILQALRDSFKIPDDGQCGLSVSIGIALFPDDGESGTHLIQKADAAMYSVKTRGRNGWSRFERGLLPPSPS
jgi:diguanylate cyclase (GGDEF)-like protein/PAS domain S-box-containing protein